MPIQRQVRSNLTFSTGLARLSAKTGARSNMSSLELSIRRAAFPSGISEDVMARIAGKNSAHSWPNILFVEMVPSDVCDELYGELRKRFSERELVVFA